MGHPVKRRCLDNSGTCLYDAMHWDTCVCVWFLSPGTLIITAVPDVTKHMKHTSWIMESYFYISPHFSPIRPLSFPCIPRFLWCFHWCLIFSIWDGPFSFTLHCRPVWLGTALWGVTWHLCSVLSRYIYANNVFCIQLVSCLSPTVHSVSRYPPTNPHTHTHFIPSPSVYCLKSHRANWDRAVSGAEETWSHHGGKLDSAFFSTSSLCFPASS